MEYRRKQESKISYPECMLMVAEQLLVFCFEILSPLCKLIRFLYPAPTYDHSITNVYSAVRLDTVADHDREAKAHSQLRVSGKIYKMKSKERRDEPRRQ